MSALPVEFLFWQRGIIFDESLLVLFALLALRWLAGHVVGTTLAHGSRADLQVGAGRSLVWEARVDWLVGTKRGWSGVKLFR